MENKINYLKIAMLLALGLHAVFLVFPVVVPIIAPLIEVDFSFQGIILSLVFFFVISIHFNQRFLLNKFQHKWKIMLIDEQGIRRGFVGKYAWSLTFGFLWRFFALKFLLLVTVKILQLENVGNNIGILDFLKDFVEFTIIYYWLLRWQYGDNKIVPDTGVEIVEDIKSNIVIENDKDMNLNVAVEKSSVIVPDTGIEIVEDIKNDIVIENDKDMNLNVAVEKSSVIVPDTGIETVEDIENDIVIENDKDMNLNVETEQSSVSVTDTIIMLIIFSYIFGLAMLGVGLVMLVSVYSFFREVWGWWIIPSSLAGLVALSIPPLGVVLSVITTYKVWGWSLIYSILLVLPFSLSLVAASLGLLSFGIGSIFNTIISLWKKIIQYLMGTKNG